MRKTQTAVTYIILTAAAVLVCFPILFSICLSFSDLNDILQGNYIPSKLDFTNYINAFNTQPLLRYMINSAVTGVLSTTLQITFAPVSYTHLFSGQPLNINLFGEKA